MELSELRDKLNKRHVKLRVPFIQGEAYAIRYAKILKAWTNEIVKNFSSLVIEIFKTTGSEPKKVMDAAGDFDWWDKFFEKHDDYIKDIEKELKAQKPKSKKRPVDYKASLSALFDYYSGRAELFTKEWTQEELANLYRYVHGKYKSGFSNISISSEYYQNIMQAVINENLALIKSIPEQILKDMQVALSQGIISGNQKELIKRLKEIQDVNEYRAEFIARDQIHKAVEAFKQVQNRALGIDYYEWQTAEDERVSSGAGGHRQNNGRIFKYGSNEAIISYSEKRGFYYGKPGDRPNCRCIALGVIPDIDEKIVKSSDGYGYELVKK